MAEAEDVVVDAARHATVFIRDTWRRHYAREPDAPIALTSLARRLDLLVSAACGTSLPLRVALSPARPTALHRLFHRRAYPRHRQAVPATNGDTIWLPPDLATCDAVVASELYRVHVFTDRGCVLCHSGSGVGKDQGGVHFNGESQKMYRELVEEISANHGTPRVDLANPANSLVLTLPSKEDPPDVHPNSTFLSSSDPDYLLILGWITEGALNN